MTTPGTRPDDGSTERARTEDALRLLTGVPVGLDVAVKGLSRGSGVYAWWADPSVFPDLPGLSNSNVPSLRLLYVGRATSLRRRILRNHLVQRLRPPLNVRGVDPEHLQAAVVAAKNAYNTASHPVEPSPTS